jgi:hypothetical protein
MPDDVELLIKEAREASRRRHSRWIVAIASVGLVIALIVASILGRSAPTRQIGSGTNRPSTALALAPCTSGAVSIANGPYVGGAMQEEAHSLTITNTSATSCLIHGFPRLVVYVNTGRVSRFSLVHHATGAYAMTSKLPKPFALTPRKSAYVFFAQTACAVGTETVLSKVALIMPKSLRTTNVVTLFRPIARCVGQSARYANPIAISPIEPTVGATEDYRH